MEPFLKLNLHIDDDTAEAADRPRLEREEPESEEARKRLIQMANRVAHRAAADSSRSKSSLFSK